MGTVARTEITLLPGARELLRLHALALPQRDDLCGAFCGALALRTAGVEEHRGEPIDQDAVALAAGSVISAVADADVLPRGEQGRRDYRLTLPSVADSAVSGTTAGGLVRAITELSAGRLAAIPYRGPWDPAALRAIFDAAAALPRPVTLLANLATRHLWGARPGAAQLLEYLLDGELAGPPADWDVGHFACVVGRVDGPRGSLYCVADTYPSLGNGGVHLQPQERLAQAIERRDMPEGGVVVVVASEDAATVRTTGADAGLVESLWDNGTPAAEMLA